jgi:hypothetical protein
MFIDQGTEGMVFYAYDVNSAYEIEGGTANNNGTTVYPVSYNLIEPQTQTTIGTGTYMQGRLEIIGAIGQGRTGEFTFDSSGNLTGTSNGGGQGLTLWNMTTSNTSAFDNGGATGTFILSSGGTPVTSCAVINSSRIVCMPQTGYPASLSIFQK